MEVIGNKGTCSDGDIPSKVINGYFSTEDLQWFVCMFNQFVRYFCTVLIIVFLSKSRGHIVTLVMEQCRLGITKYLFSQRTTNESNIILSMDCVNANSVNIFKNKTDKYLWTLSKSVTSLSTYQLGFLLWMAVLSC